MQRLKKQLLGLVLTAATALCAVPLSRSIPALTPAPVTANAAGSVTLSGDTLHLSGEITKDDLQAYQNDSSVQKVIADTGTVLPADSSQLFYKFKARSFDLDNAKTANVTNMRRMFALCENAQSIDISGFDTQKVTDMSGMFRNCGMLASLNVTGFDTSQVTDMSEMFCECDALCELDIFGFDTSKVTNMHRMFSGCRTLTELDLSALDTQNVTNMSYMFNACTGISYLNLTGFDTQKVVTMEGMFANCSKLITIDISSFRTPNLTNTSMMFYNCPKLKKIYAGTGWDMSHVSSFDSMEMFTYTTALVGGNGTVCTQSNPEYARIDKPDQPGYFTAKPYALRIAGEDVTPINADDILGNGVFSYDAANKTLHINGDYSTSKNLIASSIKDLTISTDSDSTLTSLNSYCIYTGVGNCGVLTLTGSGKLSLRGLSGIRCCYYEEYPTLLLDHANVDIRVSEIAIDISSYYDTDSMDDDVSGYLSLISSDLYAEALSDTFDYSISSGEPCAAYAVRSRIPSTKDCTLVLPLQVTEQNVIVWEDEGDMDLDTVLADGNGTPAKVVIVRKNSNQSLILVQPEDAAAYVNEYAEFSLTANAAGATAISYQWQYYDKEEQQWMNSSLPGYNTAKLTVQALLYRDCQKYRCIVSAPGREPETSDEVSLFVKPLIKRQPADCTVECGKRAQFSVLASGKNLSYQWQYNSGSGWSNSSEPSAQNATLFVDGFAYRDGYQYRCVVTAANGSSATSDAATLSIKPAINTQPQNVTVAVGETATIRISAAGKSLSYQWQYSFGSGWRNDPSDSAKTATLKFTGVATREGELYRCIVTGSNGLSTTSDTVTVTIKAKVTQNPTDVNASVGETAYFTVAATGPDLSYQWQVDNGGNRGWFDVTSFEGKNSATLEVPVLSYRDGYKFRCVVTAGNGTKDTSEAAVLNVRPVITKQPKDVAVTVGDPASISITATGKNLTYQWQYKFNNQNWTNDPSESAKTATLEFTGVATRDGELYRCIVTSSNGLSKTSNTVTVKIRPKVTANPKNVTAAVGETVQFSVTATGSGMTYQWQYNNGSGWFNSTSLGAKTRTVEFPATAYRDGQQYRCVVTGSTGLSTNSQPATLTVKPTVTESPKDVTAVEGETVYFTVKANGPNLSYQWKVYKAINGTFCWSNSDLEGNKTATLKVPVAYYRDGHRFRCVVTAGNGKTDTSAAAKLTVQAKVTTQPKTITVEKDSTAVFSIVATGNMLSYQWQYNNGSGWYNSTANGAKTSAIDFTATAYRDGQQYRCVVTSSNGTSDTSLPATLKVKPAITKQPTNQIGVAKSAVTFTIAASGNTLSYQWQVNMGSGWRNSEMSGATTPELYVPVYVYREGYQYRCVVTSKSGATTTSSPATLYVKPYITGQPRDASGKNGGVVSFHVTASGKNLSYQWQEFDSKKGWTNSTLYSAQEDCLIVHIHSDTKSCKFRCIVSSSNGTSTTSNIVSLTVK